MMKILIIITSSSQSPARVDSIAMPRARPPADNVPNPRLNPLLSVAPRNATNKSLFSSQKQRNQFPYNEDIADQFTI